MDFAQDPARYTVGWIAPLPLELTAALGMLEGRTKLHVPDDDVIYHVGQIGSHFVVMVVCPRIGIEPAATALANMRRSFPNIKHVLVVGIAGGMPCYGPDLQEQIALGDVVVGIPQHGRGGVTHYEFGAWEGRDELTVQQHTLHPSAALLTAVNNLRSAHMHVSGSNIPQFLHQLRQGLHERSRQIYEDPGAKYDHLFEDSYLHPDRGKICEGLCDVTRAKLRRDRGNRAEREMDHPHVHYGNIGSANAVVRSSAKRNELRAKHNIICLEMEAAGVISDYQGLVIRGICDYADSHKNKLWQGYAAATAAAYAKEVLLFLPSNVGSSSGRTISTGTSSGETSRAVVPVETPPVSPIVSESNARWPRMGFFSRLSFRLRRPRFGLISRLIFRRLTAVGDFVFNAFHSGGSRRRRFLPW